MDVETVKRMIRELYESTLEEKEKGPDEKYSFADVMKFSREERGWDIYEAANKLGVSPVTVDMWEREKPRSGFPKYENLKKVCELYALDVCKMMQFKDDKKISLKELKKEYGDMEEELEKEELVMIHTVVPKETFGRLENICKRWHVVEEDLVRTMVLEGLDKINA